MTMMNKADNTLQGQLLANLNHKGPKDHKGKPIQKYAFLTKNQVRKIKGIRIVPISDGRLLHVRIL